MKRGVNKVILMGNVGQNPSFQKFSNGNSVLNFSIATSNVWIDKASGEQREKTEWHRVAVFGKRAEVCEKYITSGMQLYIEGALSTRKYTDKQNVERYVTEIVVSGYDGEIQFLKGGNGGNGGNGNNNNGSNRNRVGNRTGNSGDAVSQSQQTYQPTYQQSGSNGAGAGAGTGAGYAGQPPVAPYNNAPTDNSGFGGGFAGGDDGLDDDIPFAPIGLQYPAILLCI